MKASVRSWLTEQFGGDEDIINELYAQYAADMKSRAAGLVSLYASANATALGEEGHAMKGMALQIGDGELSEPCLQLQNAGRTGDLSVCLPLIEKISAAVAAL